MLRAHIAQSVEHFLGKEEVTGSIPVVGSILDGAECGAIRRAVLPNEVGSKNISSKMSKLPLNLWLLLGYTYTPL